VVAFISLLLLAVVSLVLLLAGVVYLLSQTLLSPPRMTDGKALYVLKRMSPADVGLAFERERYEVRDAHSGRPIQIAAWWLPHPSARRTCVVIHGFGDAKVGALAWSPAWHALGWNQLLIDLRAHGESGGKFCTGGYFERDDLDAVLNDLRARRPEACERLALFGVSLGAAVAIVTAARRADIDAVIGESVFADYRRAAKTHGTLIGAPLISAVPLALRWAEHRSGARFADVLPVERVRQCAAPVLLIHGEADPFVPDDERAALSDALSGVLSDQPQGIAKNVHWIVPGAGHCNAIAIDPDAYAKTLEAFLASRVLPTARPM
jgi:uncharacterized protein